MPDVSELLEQAARLPQQGPDLAAIDARASTLRRQQTARRAGVLAAVVLVAVPLVARGSGSASHELRIEERPATTASTTPVPDRSPLGFAPGPSRPAAPRSGVRPSADVGLPAPRAGTSVGGRPAPTGPRPTASPTTGAGSGSFPEAASCHVTTRDVQAGPSYVCRFTATGHGGWRLTHGAGAFVGYDPADLRVRVQRDGVDVYDTDVHAEAADCASSVIRPGDQVTVSIETHPNNYEDLDLGAGVGYGC